MNDDKFIHSHKNKKPIDNSIGPLFAEELGFEPRVPVRVRRISSAVHSTTLASLL